MGLGFLGLMIYLFLFFFVTVPSTSSFRFAMRNLLTLKFEKGSKSELRQALN